MVLTVYTDGSALNNKHGAPAGWACLFVFDDGKSILKSGNQYSTNNAAEIQAISYGLWYSVNKIQLKNDKLVIKSDSEYAIGVISGKKNATANAKAISVCKKLMKQLTDAGCTVDFIHVMAHTNGTDDDSKFNDIVDKEARRQASELDTEPQTNSLFLIYVLKSISNYEWFVNRLRKDGHNALAIDIRCFCPPENSWGYFPKSVSDNPTYSRTLKTFSCLCSLDKDFVLTIKGSARISFIFILGLRPAV